MYLLQFVNSMISIVTDFGDQFAASQLRAVLATLAYTGPINENHDIKPFAISEGAFAIVVMGRFSPKDTIHVGVVDPGVGSKRRGIVIRGKRAWYVGPDNGLLYPAASKEGIVSAWQLQMKRISEEVSNTFHGRDVFIKAAAFLAAKQTPEEFGSKKISVSTLKKLLFREGQVLHVDHFGNIKIYWSGDITVGREMHLRTSKYIIEAPVVRVFNDVGQGRPLAYMGSHNTLEFAVNLANASKIYDIHLDDVLKIEYTEKKS